MVPYGDAPVPTENCIGLFIVFLVLAHDRRRVLHFNVTANLTAEWTAQQIVEAFPLDDAPRFLLRDRDGICGEHFCRRERNMGIEEVVIAPGRHGRILSSSALSARSAASVSIT